MADITLTNSPLLFANRFQTQISSNNGSTTNALDSQPLPKDYFAASNSEELGLYSPKMLLMHNDPKDDEKKKREEKPPLKDESKVVKETLKAKGEIRKMIDGTTSDTAATNRELKEQKRLDASKVKTEPLGLNDQPRSRETTFQNELNKSESVRQNNLNRKQNPLGLKLKDPTPERSLWGALKDQTVDEAVKDQTNAAKLAAKQRFEKINPLGTQTQYRTNWTSTSAPANAPNPGKLAVAGKAFNSIMAPVGILGGAYDMSKGVQRFQNGDRLGGSLAFTKGAGSFTTGALTTTSIFTKAAQTAGSTSRLFSTGAATASTFTKAIPIIGGVTSMADGVLTTVDGIQQGDNEKIGVGVVKTAGGGMMVLGAATLNPFLIGAGAATYTGAVLYENREAIADFGSYVWNTVTGAETTPPETPKTESGEVTVLDTFTAKVADQSFNVSKPANNSSRDIRNSILYSVGYSDGMIAAYDKAYPTNPKTKRPVDGGFYIRHNSNAQWATPKNVATWPVDQGGNLSIIVEAGSLEHLKEFYEQYVQRNGSPD